MAEKFDEATQKELASFLEAQEAQSRVHRRIHEFTSLCWDKCITGAPGQRLSRGEESCIVNCVERFLDTSLFLMRRVQEQRQEALNH